MREVNPVVGYFYRNAACDSMASNLVQTTEYDGIRNHVHGDGVAPDPARALRLLKASANYSDDSVRIQARVRRRDGN